MVPKYIKTRASEIVPFDKGRIKNAILHAFNESGEGNLFIATKMTETIVEKISRTFALEIPTVEEVQNVVEDTLMMYHFNETARKYIIYRNDRSLVRW